MANSQGAFVFSGVDNTKQAFATMNKNLQNMQKNLKNMQKSLKALKSLAVIKAMSSAVSMVTKLVKTAVNLVVNIVKSAIKTIKSLLTAAFSFIKSALSTLLSWSVKALGKVFDTLKSSAKSAFNIVKTLISQMSKAIQSFASKEQNTIQIRVAAGKDFDSVMASYEDLLRYTTASRDDVLDVYNTLASLGKTGTDLTKWAKATVWLSQISGKSTDTVLQMLVNNQNLSKGLKKMGVEVSGLSKSFTDIDRILETITPQMEALAENKSLSLLFANIKNDVIAIRENLGLVFSGPVRKIADKISEITKELRSLDYEGASKTIDDLFSRIWDKIGYVFDFIKVGIAKPEMFRKVWDLLRQRLSDIWTIVKGKLAWLGGFTYSLLSSAMSSSFEALKNPSFWSGIDTAMASAISKVGAALSITEYDIFGKRYTADETGNIIIPGKITGEVDAQFRIEQNPDGSAKIYDEDGDLLGEIPIDGAITITSDNGDRYKVQIKDGEVTVSKVLTTKEVIDEWASGIKGKVVSAWNDKVVPYLQLGDNFTISEDQEWYKNLMNIIGGIWDSAQFRTLRSNFTDWWSDTLVPLIQTTFEWLAKYLSAALTNALVNNEDLINLLNKVGKLFGWNFTTVDRQASAREAVAAKYGITAAQLEDETFLKSPTNTIPESFNVWTGYPTWKEYLSDQGYAAAYGTVLTSKAYPTFSTSSEANRTTGGGGVNSNPGWTLDANGVWVLDDESRLNAYKTAGYSGIVKAYGPDLSNIEAFVDRYNSLDEQSKRELSNSFLNFPYVDRIPKFAEGGIIDKPTLGLIGEAGPEIIVPLDKIPRFADGAGWSEVIAEASTAGTQWQNIFLESEDAMTVALENMGSTVSDIDTIFQQYKKEYDQDQEDSKQTDAENTSIWKKIWKGIDSGFSYIGKYFTKTFSLISDNGGFGEHMGNIVSGFKELFESEDGISFMKIIGVLADEILPFFQKGLEKIGGLFDEAFSIFGNAVSVLGERVGNILVPLLERFIPFFKTLSDVVLALAPVAESILQPMLTLICGLLGWFTEILKGLMPVFAGIGAVIQWVSESITYCIASLLNWLGSISIAGWYPFSGIGGHTAKAPRSISDNYNSIMSAYSANAAMGSGSINGSASANVSSQTASYSGASQIYITNDFNGSYIVGSGGMTELAKVIRDEISDLGYYGR